jgi:hypothetical protein
MVVGSFRVLARVLPRDPRMAGVQALGGATVLFAAGDDSSGEKLFKRLGFTISPYQSALGRFGEFWENLYTWALMWAYNDFSLRQRHLVALCRTESWISAEAFLRRYGTDKGRSSDREAKEIDAAHVQAEDSAQSAGLTRTGGGW